MRKVFVSVYECQPGMKIAESIYNEYGAVIVTENATLDNHIIKKLINLDITKVSVYDLPQNIIIAEGSELFKAQYNENVEAVKDVLRDITSGKNVNVEKINNITDSIFVRINENRDIVGCINQMRGIDEYTYAHSVNVSLLSMLIGKWLKYDAVKIKQLVQAGLLHDIGKSKISDEILNKSGILSGDEFEEIKKHPIYGYRIVEGIAGMSRDVSNGILMHHEREDGSGYPMGAKGSAIHEFAKIIAVADIYDAMTSDTAYRYKKSPFDVFEFMENKSFGFLDTVITNTFLAHLAAYYIGDMVRLNTGKIGEIIYINPRHICRPVIKIENTYLDLTMEKDIKILELI